MFEPSASPSDDATVEIARHEVSEDGVTWRPYDRALDDGRLLHKRIVFAAPRGEEAPRRGRGG
jgi:hypothetical protein